MTLTNEYTHSLEVKMVKEPFITKEGFCKILKKKNRDYIKRKILEDILCEKSMLTIIDYKRMNTVSKTKQD